ncbi:MAG: cyclin family protein [Promethearchaeota archaeon]
MTINKVSIPSDHTNLECDLCGSHDIVDEIQGYVCRACGVVLTVQKLQYNRPYNIEVVQHSIHFGSTQIGTIRERNAHPQSYQLKRMNRYNSQLSNKEYTERRANKEISRIFDNLTLPSACEIRVMDKFREIFPRLQMGSKYKNPEKLSAVIVYIVLKLENIAVKRCDIINISELTKEEFNNFILHVQRYLPEYTKRNRQSYVTQKLMEITEHFGLDMSFYFLSRKILSKLWDNIKNTTDDVIAGLCTSITALCNYKDVISVSSICELLNIRMSTIQFQVKKRIFERFKLPGFVSLVRSSGLLKGFMEKVGLIAGEKLDVEIIPENTDDSYENVVSIKLGGARQVFNPHNEQYFMGCFGENKTITLCLLDIHNYQEHIWKKFNKKAKIEPDVWFGLTSGEYFPRKGPPLVDKV